MDHGLVSPEWEPLVKLLHGILTHVGADLADFDPVHLAVSSGPSDALLVLASIGDGAELIDVQAHELGGPLPDAVATGLPVAVADLWSDPRWPRLTLEALTESRPHLAETCSRIHGMAVMPAGHDEHSMVALSCTLPGPADERVIEVLARYRQLLESVIAVTRATSIDGPATVLGMLQSRAIIEQAKGMIMAATACSPDLAWHLLREASQTNNVKLRDIAIALVELISRTTAEHPVGLPKPSIEPAARPAALQLWKGLGRTDGT
ncbi:MAG TPA: ANTAR domain-containing protein [Pseudonocardia sp.]|nr:ANTAR domain-containing protein [Pseudonocardia sp.]